jgi:hypothetical protein
MKLKLETHTEIFTTEFLNSDVDLEQFFDAFKGMLVANGWMPITIDQYIIELANELKENVNKRPY